jgi:hypothetical protein
MTLTQKLVGLLEFWGHSTSPLQNITKLKELVGDYWNGLGSTLASPLPISQNQRRTCW